MNGFWANSPECRPSAEIQCVPGTADVGTVNVTLAKAPLAFVPARISSVVSK